MTKNPKAGRWRPWLALPVLTGMLTVWLGPMPIPQARAVSDLDKGRALYRGHCAACHGFDGNGNGPKAAGLTPAPTNFRNATVMGSLSDNALQQAILAGKPGTAMKGYGTILKPQDVAALVKYLRSLSASP